MPLTTERAQARLLSLATIIAVVSVLYFARDVLIPLAMAILVSFLLAPIVHRLQRWGLRRVPAVLCAVLGASLTVFIVAWIFLYQMVDLGEQLPKYKENIAKKVSSLHESLDPWLRKATDAIEDVNLKLEGESPAKSGEKKESPPQDKNQKNSSHQNPAQAVAEKTATVMRRASTGESEAALRDQDLAGKPLWTEGEPVPVKVVSGPTSIPEVLSSYVGPVLAPFGTAAVIAVLVIFILIEREDLRNRFIRLIGDQQLYSTTEALDDASTRVSKYLLMQLIVNVTYGVAVSIGLWLLGMPNVVIWGLMATVLRFIPYIGPWIAAALPIVLSLAIFDGWTKPLLVIGWFLLLELLSNNVMEPMLYGASTGISSFGIIISAVFWTWLWDGVGLVMATPLTVCLMVIGRHVPQFKYIEILLGDQPPLPFSAAVYQRLLALDEDEVANTTKKFLCDHELGELFDEVFLPALLLANQDYKQGRIDEARWRYIHDAMRELVIDLQEEAARIADKKLADEAKDAAPPGEETAPAATAQKVEPLPSKGKIACHAARDISDELTCQMLSVLLLAEGYEVVAHAPREVLAKESATCESVAEHPQLLWISAIPPLVDARARELCRQLTQRFPRSVVSVGLWIEEAQPRNLALLQRAGAHDIARTLSEAVACTNKLLNPPKEDPPAPSESVNTTPLSEAPPVVEKSPAIAG